jgi:hypothetical protein
MSKSATYNAQLGQVRYRDHKCQTVGCTRQADTRIRCTTDDGSWIDQVCHQCARFYVTYSGTELTGIAVVEYLP